MAILHFFKSKLHKLYLLLNFTIFQHRIPKAKDKQKSQSHFEIKVHSYKSFSLYLYRELYLAARTRKNEPTRRI